MVIIELDAPQPASPEENGPDLAVVIGVVEFVAPDADVMLFLEDGFALRLWFAQGRDDPPGVLSVRLR
jgi:hypothetical protein